MAINPASFHPINVADTCSVWNVLSSQLLYATAVGAGCEFCITSFVRYECIFKPRKSVNEVEQALITRLEVEQSRGAFKHHSCGIEDLQSIKLLEARKSLGMGELSSIAFAMKVGQAFITDDQKARRLAVAAGHALTQTTPHLFAWLCFSNRIAPADKATVIDQHRAMRGPLEPHFNKAFELAMYCKLQAASAPN